MTQGIKRAALALASREPARIVKPKDLAEAMCRLAVIAEAVTKAQASLREKDVAVAQSWLATAHRQAIGGA